MNLSQLFDGAAAILITARAVGLDRYGDDALVVERIQAALDEIAGARAALDMAVLEAA